jgi:hypothetical protein
MTLDQAASVRKLAAALIEQEQPRSVVARKAVSVPRKKPQHQH